MKDTIDRLLDSYTNEVMATEQDASYAGRCNEKALVLIREMLREINRLKVHVLS